MALRDSQVSVEVLSSDGDPIMRNSQISVEVLHHIQEMHVAQEYVNVISRENTDNDMEVAQIYFNVISKIPKKISSQVTIIT